MGKTVLGLDLGTNSIGWALVEEQEGSPKGLLDGGVRIFPKALEDKTSAPKNQARRKARLGRRVVQRRARRKARLQNYLHSLGFLPLECKDDSIRESSFNQLGCPYELRAKALTAELSDYEFGRVITHLGARRGFQSNRKTLLGSLIDDPDVLEVLNEEALESGESELLTEQEKEESEFKAEIQSLREDINASGLQTLGAYLASFPPHKRRRGLRTDRSMLKQELDKIFEVQSGFKKILTPEVLSQLEEIIFHQRPLKLAADRLGRCSLESKRPRVRKGRLEYQEFRYLQDVNNLTYVNRATGEFILLSEDQRGLLINELEKKSQISWAGVRKVLSLDKYVKFNLEQTDTKRLTGNRTSTLIRKQIGSTWDDLNREKKIALVEDIITISDRKALKNRLVSHWKLELSQAVALATNDLEPGVGNLSLKAINKLLPHLKAGLIYSDARVKAGYDYQKASIESIQKLPAPPVIPNPVVTRALHEARRVINAVIATHGKPDIIRIEIPREVKHGKKRLDKYKKQQNKNASANRQAEQSYESIRLRHPNLHLPQNMKGDDRLKYRLWQEQKEQCIYTGRSIGMQQLFSAATEVDHILPRSRTVNDSYMNKVLCFAEPNATKGNRTPYECWGGTETYEDILSRVDASLMPFAKRKAMMKKSLEPLETFINSQLTDTSYISREVLSYVQVLGCDVSVVKGTATSWLRHQWGLNSVLGSVEKNREDHRHHFIDAVVVACTNRALYQGVAKAAKPLETHEEIKNKLKVPLPWPTLRESIVAFSEDLIVSYSPQHKVIGAFHEQTAYGVQIDPELGTERVVYRKPLDSSISTSALKDIADPALKKAIYKHLEAHGNDPKIAFSKENPFYFNDNQAPVRHLRLIKSKRFNKNSFLAIRDCSGKPYRYHLYGNNHHVEIFFNHITSKYDSRFVNTFEAAQRARNTKLHRAGDHIPESVCDPKWDEDHEFLMHLHTNDLLELDYDGQRIIYRVLSLDPSANRIVLMPATMAIKNTKAELRKTINSIFDKFNPRKVVVNSLGRIIYVKEGGRGK